MKKVFIILNLLFFIFGTYNVFADVTDTNIFSETVKENESEWLFGDGNLNFSGSIKSEKTVDGLTFMPGMYIDLGTRREFNGRFYSGYSYFPQNGTKDNGSVKFNVSGDCEIYILGRSNDVNVTRHYVLYDEKTGKSQTLAVNAVGTYKFKYTGASTTLCLYAQDGAVRAYAIYVHKYDSTEHTPLSKGQKYEWDFDSSIFGDTKFDINKNVSYNNMNLFASKDYTMKYNPSVNYNDAKVRNTGAIDLVGDCKSGSRQIDFPVFPNSDVYITARTSDSASKRKLIVTTNYSEYLKDEGGKSLDLLVQPTITTQRIKYNGDGGRMCLRSFDSGIRIYKITVVPRLDNYIENKSWDFSNNANFIAHTVDSTEVIDDLELISIPYYNVIIKNIDNNLYSKALNLRGGYFSHSGAIAFNISNSDGSDKVRCARKIKIITNSENTNASLFIANASGYLIGESSLNKEINEYTFDYTGPYDKLYIYTNDTSGNGVNVYKIEVENGNTLIPDTTKQINVEQGKTYKYFYTLENVTNIKDFVYTIYYDSSVIDITKIFDEDQGAYNVSVPVLQNNGAITILENKNGTLKFKVDKDIKNWSGIIASIECKAKQTATTSIKLKAVVAE